MVKVKTYQLPPTKLMPNSPYPLLHYPGLLASETECRAAKAHELFTINGWKAHWIFRYGPTQSSHVRKPFARSITFPAYLFSLGLEYHSAAHGCMIVLSGAATIRFGVADTDQDLQLSTYGGAREDGGIELKAEAGDVFVLPAGTAHKTFATSPQAEFQLLFPGEDHAVKAGDGDVRQLLRQTELSGFTMIGAYPRDGGSWDFSTGGDHVDDFEKVWSTPKPENDPVLGQASDGLCGLWK